MTDTLREILGGGDFKEETSEHVKKAVTRDGEGNIKQLSNGLELGCLQKEFTEIGSFPNI